MQGFIQMSRDNPELTIFRTLAPGFWPADVRIGEFNPGLVTSKPLARRSIRKPV